MIATEKTLMSAIIGFSHIIEQYKKKPDEIRFVLLIDKLSIFLELASSMTVVFSCDEEMKYDVKKGIETIKEEFLSLEDFILNKRKSELKTIATKLDDVLMGPDFKVGQEIMQEAKKDFDNLQQNGERTC